MIKKQKLYITTNFMKNLYKLNFHDLEKLKE